MPEYIPGQYYFDVSGKAPGSGAGWSPSNAFIDRNQFPPNSGVIEFNWEEAVCGRVQ